MRSKIILVVSSLCIASSTAEAQSCVRWNSYTSSWDYLYCGANAVNRAAPTVLNRVVPGGGYAYRAGNYIGNYVVAHPVQPRVYSPPPLTQYGYTAPALPRQLQRYAPIYPRYR